MVVPYGRLETIGLRHSIGLRAGFDHNAQVGGQGCGGHGCPSRLTMSTPTKASDGDMPSEAGSWWRNSSPARTAKTLCSAATNRRDRERQSNSPTCVARHRRLNVCDLLHT